MIEDEDDMETIEITTKKDEVELEAKVEEEATRERSVRRLPASRTGRSRKAEKMPTTSDLEYHAEIALEKMNFVMQDPILKASLARDDSTVMLHLIKAEVAKESASLHFQRMEFDKQGKDTAQLSTRRIDALAKIATLELEIKKMGGDLLDIRSEKFQSVFKLLVSDVLEIAGEVLEPKSVDLFTNRLMTKLEGWEERASVKIGKR